jgi:hypothetical protein
MGNLPTDSYVISGGHVTNHGVTNTLNFPDSKMFILLISQLRDFKYRIVVKMPYLWLASLRQSRQPTGKKTIVYKNPPSFYKKL